MDLTPFTATAQLGEGFYDVELNTVPVAGNVHMIQRPDGFANVGVFVGEEGVLLVDSQFEPHAEDLVAAVRKLSDGEIRFLINTHVHPDHIGGNAPLATGGDTFVHFPESNVLHLGDVFRTTSYPIIDVYNGGTLAGTIEAINLAISLADPETRVIPGHGIKVVGRRELIQFRDMTVDISERVRALIAEGKTLTEVMAARPTAAYDEQWGKVPSWNQSDFVPIVYHQLGGGSHFEQ
jgi:glyoxylase-like metal-dependent hydrolase (beta-lactamase superfamily II)